MTATREYDIVLYGATGFVGRLTAEYLARAAGGARIALAGRSTERLLAIRETLGESAQSWPVLVADAASPSTLDAMAAQTRVVVTTVGPYSRYGLPLVGACAAAGTDYADLTGEPPFVRDSIDLYHKQALDTGARIVHACGFDSIPSDLTVYALYRRAREDGAGELGKTDFVVRSVSGGFSGGTIASAVEVMRTVSSDPDARRQFADPYTLSPDRDAEPELGAQPDLRWRRGRQIAPELTGLWTAGFRDGAHQHPNRSTQQRITRVGLRQAIPLQRAHESGVLGRGAGGVSGRQRGREHGDRVGQPLFPAAAIPAGGAGAAQTGHRPQRGRSPARLSTRPRPTPPRPPAPVISPPSPSMATPDTRPPRCCWGKAVWRWLWTVTSSRSYVAC